MRVRDYIANPWGRPRFLVGVTWAYIVFSLVPVVVALAFSFNSGRSIAVWQGFSLTRWYFGDPQNSVLHDPALLSALLQTLKLAALDVAIATPLGTFLALGLTRWRGYGARPANWLMMLPLVTPELVLGVAIYLTFQLLYTKIHPSTTAQVLGQVTFMIPFVVIVVRARLLAIGPEYEEAAADLGASPRECLQLVLLPLMLPAILASMVVVFALALDDFVTAQWLSCGNQCATIPIKIYNATRAAPLPSINATAVILVIALLCIVGLAYLVHRRIAGPASSWHRT